MNLIASDRFDASAMCGTLCLQHKVNEFLYDLKNGDAKLIGECEDIPPHINFIYDWTLNITRES